MNKHIDCIKTGCISMFPLPSIHNGLIYLRLNLFYDQHSFRYFQHTALIIAGKCRHSRSFSSLYHWTGFRLVLVFRFQLILLQLPKSHCNSIQKIWGELKVDLAVSFPKSRVTCCYFLWTERRMMYMLT